MKAAVTLLLTGRTLRISRHWHVIQVRLFGCEMHSKVCKGHLLQTVRFMEMQYVERLVVVVAAMSPRTLRTELHNLEGSEAGFASLFQGVIESRRAETFCQVMVKAVEWLTQHGPTAFARERRILGLLPAQTGSLHHPGHPATLASLARREQPCQQSSPCQKAGCGVTLLQFLE